MEEIEKYERKLERAMRKRGREPGGEEQEGAGEERERRVKKIQKYEKKIQKAREALESQANAAAAATSASASLTEGGVVDIDKSGMTLLLFYAYVEPIWKPAEHAEVMRWAQSTLEGYGETLLLAQVSYFLCRCDWPAAGLKGGIQWDADRTL